MKIKQHLKTTDWHSGRHVAGANNAVKNYRTNFHQFEQLEKKEKTFYFANCETIISLPTHTLYTVGQLD